MQYGRQMNTDNRQKLLEDEEKRLRTLRFVVDLAQALLMQSSMPLDEAYGIMENTRRAALNLFPGKEEVYDLIYAPRFQRIIDERFAVPNNKFGSQ